MVFKEKSLGRKVSIAPMLDWTDRHCRYFLRLISRHILLYTEMVVADAILRGKQDWLLKYDASEHPVALQLGGSDPKALAECAKIAEGYGYDEVNLNVGCPSDRVQSGRFGACLMKEPELVAECVAAMQAAVNIPVTVKTRIGVDERDSYENLADFVQAVAGAGCHTFILHARKAWLKGLSPKENREIPPLQYEKVYQIKKDFPQLEIVINGGIVDLEQIQLHLQQVDGVMIGRAAYQNPYLLSAIDPLFHSSAQEVLRREKILEAYLPYVEEQLRLGVFLSPLVKPILGLFQGVAGARAWRRHLSENACKKQGNIETIKLAFSKIIDP